MAQAAAVIGLLYFALVYFLSFLLEKFRILTKPPLPKGFWLSELSFIGIALAMFGFFIYGSSRTVGVLCCLAGVILGVVKASSDSLAASVVAGSSDAAKREPAAGANEPVAMAVATETAEPEAMAVAAEAAEPEAKAVAAEAAEPEAKTVATETVEPEAKAVAAEAAEPEAKATTVQAPAAFHEQVILSVLAGKGGAFVGPYMLLSIGFSISVILVLLAALVLFQASVFGEARPDDVAAFFKRIASFNFGSTVLRKAAGSKTDALVAAYALAAGIALLILAVVLGLSIRTLRSRKIAQKAISALLPGRKRGFVPCPEGIYKLRYRNPWSKNRLYSLYPWESLTLYAIDERKKRVVLKAGRMQIPLIPWSREGGLFDSLKAVVIERLPKERQAHPLPKSRYRWGRVAVAVFAVLVLQAVLASWLDGATVKGEGTKYCDVRGSVHYSFQTFLQTEIGFYEMRDDRGKILYRYCELHGICYVILHPATYVPVLRSLLSEGRHAQSPVRSVMFLETLTFPAMVWLELLILVLFAGKAPRFRFNTL